MRAPLQEDLCEALGNGPLTIAMAASAVGTDIRSAQQALVALERKGAVRRRGWFQGVRRAQHLFELCHPRKVVA